MGMGMMNQQPGFDAAGAYKLEKDLLSIAKHEWIAEEEERRFLGARYPDTSMPQVDLSKFKKKN